MRFPKYCISHQSGMPLPFESSQRAAGVLVTTPLELLIITLKTLEPMRGGFASTRESPVAPAIGTPFESHWNVRPGPLATMENVTWELLSTSCACGCVEMVGAVGPLIDTVVKLPGRSYLRLVCWA